MVHPHGAGGRVVGARHGRRRRRVPVGRLGHLAAGGQIAVGAGHVAQARGVHAGPLQAAGVEARLVQVRVVHYETRTTIIGSEPPI